MASTATATEPVKISSSVAVKRIYELQEERKAEYDKLKRAQDTYTSSPDPMLPQALSQYQSEISSITTTLSNVSQEFGKLMQLLRERGNSGAAGIIESIQEKEIEKVQLVVQYQVMEQTLKTRKSEGSEEEYEDESGVDFTGSGDTLRWTPKLRELRRKLAASNSDIASLMEELRFECETLLTE